MGTRRFCDHCGNTCRNPKVYSYGPSANYIMQTTSLAYQNTMAAANAITFTGNAMYGSLGGSGGSGAYSPAPPHISHTDVDLCDTCAPIWLERVRKLTAASDPEGT